MRLKALRDVLTSESQKDSKAGPRRWGDILRGPWAVDTWVGIYSPGSDLCRILLTGTCGEAGLPALTDVHLGITSGFHPL